MKKLVVLDEGDPKVEHLRARFGDEFLVFPLSSSLSANEAVAGIGREAGVRVVLIDSGVSVNRAAERCRSRVVDSIGNLSQDLFRTGETLSEYFSFHNGTTSSWWFSRVIEKSPYKSSYFQQSVQVEAIQFELRAHDCDELIYAGEDPILSRCLGRVAQNNGSRFRTVSVKTKNPTRALLLWLKRHIGIWDFILLLHRLGTLLWVGWLRRRSIRRTPRKPLREGGLLLCSHFPGFNEEEARLGHYVNSYFGPLGPYLKDQHQDVSWILIYAPSGRWTISQAIQMANRFIQNGESLCFAEEFIDFSLLARTLWDNFRMGIRFRFRRQEIIELFHRAGLPWFELAEKDWSSSFGGSAGFEGILWYHVFCRFFTAYRPGKILFSTEAHAWEKALLAAKQTTGLKSIALGYQSASVSTYLLNYWNTPEEITGPRRTRRLPLPDVLVCNGRAPWRGFRSCGWPEDRLVIGEALRYKNLDFALQVEAVKKKPVLLVALSINPREAVMTLRFLAVALQGWEGGEVWIRPHPFLDLSRSYLNAGIVAPRLFKTPAEKDLRILLKEAAVVVAGESSVSLEAVAFGCRVLAVDGPECINMSPLRDYESSAYASFSSPSALREEVERCVSRLPCVLVSDEERRRVIRDFFELAWDKPNRISELIRTDVERRII